MKVAAILNDREVAIAGNGVEQLTEGTVLVVRSAPRIVTDPDSGETIGQVTDVKAVLKVYETQKRMALARTFRERHINVGGQFRNPLTQLMSPPKWETRTETLRRDRQQVDDLDEGEATVQVGDAVEVFEGNPDDIPTASVWR